MDIAHLKRQRGMIRGKITRISNFLNNFSSGNVEEVQARQEGLADIQKQFDHIQTEIEELVCNESNEIIDEHTNYRIDFENEYYDVLSKTKSIINSLSRQNPASINLHQAPLTFKAKLPTIKLPSFDGDYQTWPSFKDSFYTLVHNVDHIPKITKFQYLKGSLLGNAADLIESLNITDSNYDIAWNLLQDRYNNKRIIVQTHVNAIFNQTKIESPNSVAIRNLHSSINKHLRALQALDEPVEQWSTLLVHIVSAKLDRTTLKRWEESLKGTDVPSFDTLAKFLQDTANSLEGFESKNKSYTPQVSNDRTTRFQKPKIERNNCLLNQNKFISVCPLCKQSHKIYSCDKFLKLNISDRYEAVKNLKLCFNCLSKNHSVKDCRSSNCKYCKIKHNTLLHSNSDVLAENSKNPNLNSNFNAPASNEPINSFSDTTVCNFSNHTQSSSKVLLSTSIVKIKDKFGNFISCRAVLDSGSQLSFITKKLSDKLKLGKHKASICVKGLSGSNSHTVNYINAEIYSDNSNFNTTLQLHVLPTITNSIPLQDIQFNQFQMPSHIRKNLADPKFHESSPVDLLLGAEIFFHLLKPEQVSWGNHSLIFQNTVFGWVVSGKIKSEICNAVNSLLLTAANFIHERKDSSSKITREEELCVKAFETTQRDSNGRFIGQLPFKDDPAYLNDNLNNSIKRFHLLEKRFHFQPHVHEQYVNFMREYEQLGHMREVRDDKLHDGLKYYIPHHPVFKESTTTQIRVVFDATSKPPDGNSLNSILLKGPVIQSDLFSIMIRFRTNKYALTADIAKMYRQILIEESHTNFQRIVWRETPEQELKHYQLLTLTYGTTPASFIATKCLSHLAQEYKDLFPLASQIIENDFYMDDLMTGSDSYDELKIIQVQVSNILRSGCFVLRKWCSNSKELLKLISSDIDEPHHVVNLSTCDSIKTLGLVWKPFLDTFEFSIRPIQQSHIVSRRIILSEISKIFDPLGFLTPIVIKGKIFIQQLWLNNIGWDDPLPYDLTQKWITFANQLSLLQDFHIPRRAKYSHTMELHGFCDASENAYAACVYIRSIIDSEIQVHLLCSKARVAPLKKRTLPELELNGANLLTKLMLKIIKSLNVTSNNCHYWTDSSIVLAWLSKNPLQLKTYTSNRVSHIQENSNIRNWKHVKSEHNPSDIATRGMDVKHFLTSTMWVNGPCWLSLPQTEWPPSKINRELIKLPELKAINYSLINSCTTSQSFELLSRYSSWTKLVRVVGYILRFVNNLKLGAYHRVHGYLTTQELHKAKVKIYKLTQAEGFAKEIKALREGVQLDRNCKIHNLKPFLDKEGLLRNSFSYRTTKSVPEQLATEGIEWKFIPACSPHFGGIWEAGIKCVKYHLKRTIGDSILNFEELYTVLSQIEAILNSRPLTTLSSSPNDLAPLTPAHFLVGDSLLIPTEEDYSIANIDRLKRWRLVQAMVQHFWKRWASEYLMQLQQRIKWKESCKNIKIGDIVLLENASLPPQHWLMARVTKIHPGADGVVRVATVRTSSGKVFTRAVNKLYPLPNT